jgi:hypothetical protein
VFSNEATSSGREIESGFEKRCSRQIEPLANATQAQQINQNSPKSMVKYWNGVVCDKYMRL